jgi:hypothetical protein
MKGLLPIGLVSKQPIQQEPTLPDLPSALSAIGLSFSSAFTKPTFARFLSLFIGVVVSSGRRTVLRTLASMRELSHGHWSSYHRLFCKARWSTLELGRILASLVLAAIPKDQPVVIAVDDTVTQHRGKNVWGKGCHRDAVRSSHSHTVWRWGHKWVVLAVSVPMPLCIMPWALPVACALYKPREEGRHKTPSDLARQLLRLMERWFPKRRFILLGDGGFNSHEFARKVARRSSLVSRFFKGAVLHGLPVQTGRGRPRITGTRLPTPEAAVKRAKLREAEVSWYGGKKRKIALCSGEGYWYRQGKGLLWVRWVFVKDMLGTHRDEYFFTTDRSLSEEDVVSMYTRRWPIEVMFQEARAQLGLNDPRQWKKASVLRMTPCMFGLYSVIALFWRQAGVPRMPRTGYVKMHPTFSDAMEYARRELWEHTILNTPLLKPLLRNTPRHVLNPLISHLALAA